MIELTNDEVKVLMDLIELNIFQIIRDDVDIDNMNWLVNVVNIYSKCKKVVDIEE